MIRFSFPRILLFADAAEGAGTETTTDKKTEGNPPPMSETAATGKKSEREIELEKELEARETALANERARADEAENGKKKVETEHATLRDSFDRFKQAIETKPGKGFRLPTVLD